MGGANWRAKRQQHSKSNLSATFCHFKWWGRYRDNVIISGWSMEKKFCIDGNIFIITDQQYRASSRSISAAHCRSFADSRRGIPSDAFSSGAIEVWLGYPATWRVYFVSFNDDQNASAACASKRLLQRRGSMVS
jgi:hypothetical protein